MRVVYYFSIHSFPHTQLLIIMHHDGPLIILLPTRFAYLLLLVGQKSYPIVVHKWVIKASPKERSHHSSLEKVKIIGDHPGPL